METMASVPSRQTTASISSFEAAFNSLKDSVSAKDAAAFQSTTLEEVWKATEEIQLAQRQRKSLRNVRRVEPFLKCLEKYSKVIEVLCNGTPYLPWIWVRKDSYAFRTKLTRKGSYKADDSSMYCHVMDEQLMLIDSSRTNIPTSLTS
jgi:hypothetical protein